MLIKNLMSLTSITAIALAILGVNLPINTAKAQTTVKEEPNIEIDADEIENPVEDPADVEDADFLEGDEDVSVTETEEDIPQDSSITEEFGGDTSVIEETNENYADEMDDDIMEDSIDDSDALEPKQPQSF